MLGCGVELVVDLPSVKFPWWKMRGGEVAALLFCKCFWLRVLRVPCLLLAGLGGEGEEEREAGCASVFVGGASRCLLLWPAVAARGGADRDRLLRFGAGCAGGFLLRLGFVRPWWYGERRREVGVGGGPGRRCTGGKLGGVGEEKLWPCPFKASDSVACGGWTLRPSTMSGGSSSPAGARYGGAGGD